jgi:hypothetical protein
VPLLLEGFLDFFPVRHDPLDFAAGLNPISLGFF